MSTISFFLVEVLGVQFFNSLGLREIFARRHVVFPSSFHHTGVLCSNTGRWRLSALHERWFFGASLLASQGDRRTDFAPLWFDTSADFTNVLERRAGAPHFEQWVVAIAWLRKHFITEQQLGDTIAALLPSAFTTSELFTLFTWLASLCPALKWVLFFMALVIVSTILGILQRSFKTNH